MILSLSSQQNILVWNMKVQMLFLIQKINLYKLY